MTLQKFLPSDITDSITRRKLNNLIEQVDILIGSSTAFGELSVSQNTGAIHLEFPYGVINTDLVTDNSTGSGSITASAPFIQINSGAATSSKGDLSSVRVLQYKTGLGGLIRYTAIFDTAVAGNTQVVGIGDGVDGLFFGYNGTAFGVLKKNDSVDTWVAQTAWSEDTMDGNGPSGMTLDTTKGNVYQIKFQWLGFGQISFYVENPATGAFTLVHKIQYANANTDTSIQNPTLPACIVSENTTNDTNIVIKVPSFAALNEGIPDDSGPLNAANNSATVTTENNIVTIRNKSTYNSITNRVRVKGEIISLATDGTKTVKFRVIMNATLGGTPSYTDIDTTNSVVEVDTAGTTITGGKFITSFQLAKVDALTFDLNSLDWQLSPGSTITISAQSSGSNDVEATLTWRELF